MVNQYSIGGKEGGNEIVRLAGRYWFIVNLLDTTVQYPLKVGTGTFGQTATTTATDSMLFVSSGVFLPAVIEHLSIASAAGTAAAPAEASVELTDGAGANGVNIAYYSGASPVSLNAFSRDPHIIIPKNVGFGIKPSAALGTITPLTLLVGYRVIGG